MDAETKLTAKGFATDQEVRWCPGCGDYAVLKSVQKTLADLHVDPNETVFVSGIGCAARFPYYLETYGFHTIHGRAAAIGTGVKLAHPELDVWLVSGDGDALSIGGNHFIHLVRRNLNVQYLLFNNEIYGLTKGQFSPTSRPGTLSPSSPKGSIEQPVHAASLALGAGARFFARATDVGQAHLIQTLKAAHEYEGTSLIEILQNCIVYNDGIHKKFTEKATQADSCIFVEHGKPLVFGKDKTLGLRMPSGSLRLEVVQIGVDVPDESHLLVHDETSPVLAQMLARMDGEELPVALGVLYRVSGPVYELQVRERSGTNTPSIADLQALISGGHTWEVH